MRGAHIRNATVVCAQAPLLYLKPVQTGFPDDSDAALVVRPSLLASDHSPGEVNAPDSYKPLQIRPGLRLGTQAAGAGTAATAGRHAAQLLGPSSGSYAPSSGQPGPVEAHVLHAWSMPVSPHLAVEREGAHSSVIALPPRRIHMLLLF